MDADALPAALAAALLAAGYRVGGPVGVGAGGPAWTVARPGRADEDRPERLVAQVVVLPDPDARARLARRLETLWELANPHLPEVVDVVVVPADAGDGEVWAVLLGEVPGATVAALLAARGRLSPGEVVTLTVPVAGALDALHRAGWVHGDVSPANLVVRPDGRPVLIDVLGQPGAPSTGPGAGVRPGTGDSGAARGLRGTPGFVAPEVATRRAEHAAAIGPDGLPADAPGDVYALAGVALAALDLAAHDGRLGAELRAASALDPVRRPTAAELAGALYACADPEPIGQPDAGVLARAELAQLAAPSRTVSAPEGARHRAGRRRAPLRGRLAVVAVAAVVAAGGAAWAVAERGEAGSHPPVAPGSGEAAAGQPPTPSPPSETSPRDAAAAAAALTRLRAEVLADGDPARLAEVAVPGSPAHRADAQLLERLAAADGTLDGMRAVVEEAVVAGAVEAVADAATATGASASSGTVPPDAVPPDAVAPEEVAPNAGPDRAGGPAPTTVDVRVRSALTAHVRRSPSGVAEVAAQPPGTVVLRLVLTPDGWRVTDVRPG